MKLGLKTARSDARTLHLSQYATTALPEPPPTVNWAEKVPAYGTLLNTQIGDCAIAGPLHQIQTWKYADGGSFEPTDQMALADYEAVSGYRPGNPDTDQGCILLDVMNYWRRHGIGGHRIGGYARVTPTNHHLVSQSVWLFGSLSIGVRLPAAVNPENGWTADYWAMPSHRHRAMQSWDAGSWGGHMVPIVGYDAAWAFIVSWGKLMRASWAFLDAYCDEMYAPISADFMGADGKAPNGFLRDALVKDLMAIG